MNSVLCNAIFPHPAIIVPEVGKESLEKVKKTYEGASNLAKQVVESGADCLVLITPHGPAFQDALVLWDMEKLQGSLADFGAPEVKVEFTNDLPLVDKIVEKASAAKIPALRFSPELAEHYGMNPVLDHASVVPLYYLQKAGFQGKLVIVCMGFLPYPELYTFGVAMQEAINERGGRVAVITSGDLSHRLTPDAPAGYNPEARVLDEKIVSAIKAGKAEDLIYLDEDLIEKGGECGLRPLIIGLGALDGWQTENTVFSYEGPFGVGYMTALVRPIQQSQDRRIKDKLFQRRQEEIDNRRKGESPLVQLARQTVEGYLRKGDLANTQISLTDDLPAKAGVFVSLKKHGQLRGCIGTTEATRGSLKEEVMANALSAALRDPRFPPVEEDELEDLVYSVDVLGEPEAINDISELDPKEYGVIVQKGGRSGLLLPDLEGIDTVEEQVSIAKQKAGIAPNQEVELYRFTVQRYK